MDPLTIALLGSSAIKGISGFFGSQSAEDAEREAALRAQAAYDQQANRAEGAVRSGYGGAIRTMRPWEQTGAAANTMYADALGVNGGEAQSAFFSGFQNDPGYQATLQAGIGAIDHSNAVRGTTGTGAIQKELFDFGQRQQYSQFQDRLNRLSGLGQQGFQAAGTIANAQANRGTSLADIAMSRGKQAYGTNMTMGQSESSGIQNRTNIFGNTITDMVSGYFRTPQTGGSPFGTYSPSAGRLY